MIQVSPPVSVEDLDKKINEVNVRNEWYQSNGQSKLAEQIKELKSAAVEESKEEVKEEQPEEEERSFRGRGGRGGRGRGGYGESRGDRGEQRGGRGRGTRPQTAVVYAEKSEFQGEDDEQVYAAPSRPQAKKQKQKQSDLEVTEDNYPVL